MLSAVSTASILAAKKINSQPCFSVCLFIFLAANIDAEETAEDIGIRRERAVSYTQDREGVEATYAVMCDAITSVRKSKGLDECAWREKLDKDNKRRNNEKESCLH